MVITVRFLALLNRFAFARSAVLLRRLAVIVGHTLRLPLTIALRWCSMILRPFWHRVSVWQLSIVLFDKSPPGIMKSYWWSDWVWCGPQLIYGNSIFALQQSMRCCTTHILTASPSFLFLRATTLGKEKIRSADRYNHWQSGILFSFYCVRSAAFDQSFFLLPPLSLFSWFSTLIMSSFNSTSKTNVTSQR